MSFKDESKDACVAGISRNEFLSRILKGAAVAGVALAGPRLIDKFLIPPAYAGNSSCNVADTNITYGTNADIATSGTGDAISFSQGDTLCDGD